MVDPQQRSHESSSHMRMAVEKLVFQSSKQQVFFHLAEVPVSTAVVKTGVKTTSGRLLQYDGDGSKSIKRSVLRVRVKLCRSFETAAELLEDFLQKLQASDKLPDHNLFAEGTVAREKLQEIMQKVLTAATASLAVSDTTDDQHVIVDDATATVKQVDKYNASPQLTKPSVSSELLELDLNKVPDEINQKAKNIMNVGFESNRLKPGDAGYVWDKRADFNPDQSNEWDEESMERSTNTTNNKIPLTFQSVKPSIPTSSFTASSSSISKTPVSKYHGDDDDDDDLDDIDDMLKDLDDIDSKKASTTKKTIIASNSNLAPSTNHYQYEPEPEPEPDEILELDLNKVSDDMNKKAKNIMNVGFESNRLKPGDAGYVWDKRADFNPDQSNEWDEEDD